MRWVERAACRGMDTELWFPLGHGDQFAEQIEQAKAICLACPVQRSCLADAVLRPTKYGIYGGMTELERAHLRRNDKRRRHPQYAHLWEETG